jgi:uncharacterized protein (DUF1499 family)
MLAGLSGFGTRWGWWHFSTGFTILKGAAFGALAAIVIAVTVPFLPKFGGGGSMALTAAAVVAGLMVAGIPWLWLQDVKRLPFIHDITTDTQDPPRFVSVLPLRKDALNTAEYGGAEVAAQQQQAYPGVQPLIMPTPPDRSFGMALDAAKRMGWEIVDASAPEGRIEATDTTFWYGFRDDVVIRIRKEGPGSRVDVRSVSRAGKSDVGTNARRILKYLAVLRSLKG